MNRVILFLFIALSAASFLSAEDFGSAAAKEGKVYTVDEMLLYALEDEHLALAEYEALMNEFDLQRPYSNIARSERTHISLIEDIYNQYGKEIPLVAADEHIVLPSSPDEAAKIGVQAEINNINMYEIFLEQDIPEDIAALFTQLRDSSENHLRAFENQLTRSSGSGRGNNKRKG